MLWKRHNIISREARSRIPFPTHINTLSAASFLANTANTVATLLGNTDIQVNILGLDIGLPKAVIQGAVLDTLTGLTKPLDELLYNTLTLLGIKIGEADVRVTDVRCQQSVLVQ